MASVLCLDAYSANDLNGGAIEYEDTPSGCGAGKISLGLTYEEVVNRGYYRGLNIVEISSGDNTLKTSAAAGANKYYVTEGTWAFDPAQGEDAQQVYFYDGSKLTMRVPVTGIGSDGGGAYITTSAPLGGGTVPAYTAGTIIGRRRYCGRIIRRQVTVQRVPGNIFRGSRSRSRKRTGPLRSRRRRRSTSGPRSTIRSRNSRQRIGRSSRPSPRRSSRPSARRIRARLQTSDATNSSRTRLRR
jgi:hypothetical protein